MSDNNSQAGADIVQMALDNPNAPKIYVNGFQIASTNADIIIATQQNGRPVGVINMPFEIAKTLVEKLGITIGDIEEKTKTEFLTTDEFNSALGGDPIPD